MKTDIYLVLATKRRCSIFILKNNSDIGAAKTVKTKAIMDDVPPTSPKTPNSP